MRSLDALHSIDSPVVAENAIHDLIYDAGRGFTDNEVIQEALRRNPDLDFSRIYDSNYLVIEKPGGGTYWQDANETLMDIWRGGQDR